MSRIGISADFHCANHRVLGGPVVAGVNLRCRLIGETARRAFQIAADDGCDYFAILGDIFDNGKPSPEVIGVMADAIAASPIPVYVIPGNHDCSSDEVGNHALAALRKVKNCRVVDEPLFLQPGGIIFAPFSPRPPVEYFTELLERAGKGCWSLLGHVGIVGPETSEFLTNGRNIITVEQIFGLHAPKGCNLRVVASGDFHQHVIHEGVLGAVNIVQVGALCQANFGDPPEVGRICVLDTAGPGITKILHVPGPRFLTMSVNALVGHTRGLEDMQPDRKDCDFFLSVECVSEDEQRDMTAYLAEYDDPPLRGWKTEILPSAKAASEVVEAVRGAVQVEEALGEWAAAQPVSEAVKQRATQIAEECLR